MPPGTSIIVILARLNTLEVSVREQAATIARQAERIGELEAENAELRRRLGLDSRRLVEAAELGLARPRATRALATPTIR